MTQKDLHKRLLFRLIPAWFILSVVIGTAVYSVELRKIDDLVKDLAAEGAMPVLEAYRQHLNAPEHMDLDLYVRKNRDESGKGNFIVIELYSKEKKLVAEAIRQGSEPIELEMDRYRHEFMMKGRGDYKKLSVGTQLYVMVMEPLNMEDGTTEGYFEGIYEVDQGTMKEVMDKIRWSVLQVVMIISITGLILHPLIISLNRQLIRSSMALFQANLGMIEILGNAIAKKDCGTSIHNYRVTIYAIRLAEAIGLSGEEMKGVIKGALLHDMGKIAISDAILLKPDALSPEEKAVMRTHIQHGVDIIRDYQWLSDAMDVIAYHHERFDGKGFLKGLQGAGIPLSARIFTVCDVFDALMSKRPYKEALSFDQSMQTVRQMRGTHFDPMVVDTFDRLAKKLCEEIGKADEDSLKQMLKQLMDKYFGIQPAEPAGSAV